MRAYCTYFDKNYLLRGLALFKSMKKHLDEFQLYVLCFDDEVEQAIQSLGEESLIAISLNEFIESFPQLKNAKKDRTFVEFYWTCSPFLPLFLFEKKQVDYAIYLDADLFFFSSPEPTFEELGENDIYIVPHRFSPKEEEKNSALVGKFNVGYLIFKNTENSKNCLNWWGKQCIENCKLDLENGKCGDQKYLDNFQKNFEKVYVCSNLGVNIGEWNFFRFNYSTQQDSIYVENDKLVVFHFNSIEFYQPNIISCSQDKRYDSIYSPYVSSIKEALETLNSLGINFIFSNKKMSIFEKMKTTLKNKNYYL